MIYQSLQRLRIALRKHENLKLDPMGPDGTQWVDSFFCMSIFQLKQFLEKETEITKNYEGPITIYKALYYYLTDQVGPRGRNYNSHITDEEADPERLLFSVKFTSQLNGRVSV